MEKWPKRVSVKEPPKYPPTIMEVDRGSLVLQSFKDTLVSFYDCWKKGRGVAHRLCGQTSEHVGHGHSSLRCFDQGVTVAASHQNKRLRFARRLQRHSCHSVSTDITTLGAATCSSGLPFFPPTSHQEETMRAYIRVIEQDGSKKDNVLKKKKHVKSGLATSDILGPLFLAESTNGRKSGLWP